MARKLTVKLPDPGLPSDRHRDDQVVFYHGPRGEFTVDGTVGDAASATPIADQDGNAYSVKALRDMAHAALAAVECAQSLGHPVT